MTIAGFVFNKRMKDVSVIKNILMVSSWFMVFLLLITIAIEVITESMP